MLYATCRLMKDIKLYFFLIEIGGSDTADHPDSELDSGISVNGNYDQIETPSRNGGQQQHMRHIKGLQDYERIEEMHGNFLHFSKRMTFLYYICQPNLTLFEFFFNICR